MSNKRCIYSNRCWLDNKIQPATICFENGIITSIENSRLDGAEDVGDNVLMPGVIDVHVHINEPGRTDWEGFETATQAAAAAGITTVIDMPLNSSPVTVSLAAFNEKLTASKNKMAVNCGFYGGLIPGNIDDLQALIDAGVLGIKCFLVHSGIDEFPNVGENEIDEAMPILAKNKIPLLAHCEMYDEEIRNDLALFPTSYPHYLSSRPKKWENDAIAMMIALCRKHKCAVHIVHVASAEALDMIEKAKEEGLPVTAETCPHYIYFNAEDIPDGNSLYKCAPPIRERENNTLLKQALASGVLDLVSTDHSPAPPSIKEIESGDLQKAWGGIAGLQFLLPASWTALKDFMTLEKFIPLLTEHPANFLNIHNRKGILKTGCDADIVIWDPEESFEVKNDDILHRHKISPYIGEHLYGHVYETIVNGNSVFKQNKLINKTSGQWLLRK